MVTNRGSGTISRSKFTLQMTILEGCGLFQRFDLEIKWVICPCPPLPCSALSRRRLMSASYIWSGWLTNQEPAGSRGIEISLSLCSAFTGGSPLRALFLPASLCQGSSSLHILQTPPLLFDLSVQEWGHFSMAATLNVAFHTTLPFHVFQCIYN